MADRETLEETAAFLLRETTGLDVEGDHGFDTPRRFVSMLQELTTRTTFKFTTFPNTEHVDEMVIVQDIPFYTLCNHHVIPFFGHAHIAYVPDTRLVGLSKFARVVREAAKGLWVQEHLTLYIADFLEAHLDPKGIAVIMEAEHLCMTMRGVQVLGTKTTTSAMRGVFGDHSRTAKQEFMEHIRRSK